jgi:hypothetical protein
MDESGSFPLVKRELPWGQTPWDTFSRQVLLHEVWRMYSALVSCYSALRICKVTASDSCSYFGSGGTGWRALEKGRQILDPLYHSYGEEERWRAFFRYADDLLFDDPIGAAWVVCPNCGRTYGRLLNSKETQEGKRCQEIMGVSCPGILRKFMWTDILPEER